MVDLSFLFIIYKVSTMKIVILTVFGTLTEIFFLFFYFFVFFIV